MNDDKKNLVKLGWDGHFSVLFEPYRLEGLVPGRVVRQLREQSAVTGEFGERLADVSGRFRHLAEGPADYPAVGDWVALEPCDAARGVIHAVLPRMSAFARKTAGGATEAQIVAANIDTVFLVTGLDGNFNIRRIERYLTAAWESGAFPVIVLNKADLRPDLNSLMTEVEITAAGAPVIAVSAREGAGIEALDDYLEPGKTIAVLGPSGVGKSTLINRLLGEERFRTSPVREDDSRGRHTTTHRELVTLPGGTLLIDTPGMRELGLWADDESLGRSFNDISRLADACRFADCRHENEPGCAVRAAIENGTLDIRRFESFLKQKKELAFLALKQDEKTLRRSEKEFGRDMAGRLKDVKRRNLKYR